MFTPHFMMMDTSDLVENDKAMENDCKFNFFFYHRKNTKATKKIYTKIKRERDNKNRDAKKQPQRHKSTTKTQNKCKRQINFKDISTINRY